MDTRTLQYGVLMEMFLNVMEKQDPELHHKSFYKKITNRLNRYHKRKYLECNKAETKARAAIQSISREHNAEISIGALCWLVYNRHKEVLKPYNFDVSYFEALNQHYNAQGVTMQTAKILNRFEEAING